MERVNKTKVLLGGAIKRKSPSKASLILNNLKILSNNVLDYGCGYGFDADLNSWEKYDPYYFDNFSKNFKNIVCINVLNVVSSKIRKEIILNIKIYLKMMELHTYVVPRNIPICGKYSNFQRRPQNYVILSLDSIYKDKKLEIYKLDKKSIYKDSTFNIGESN